jgi:hypothetical protein
MSSLVAEELRQGPTKQRLPARPSGRSEPPGRHRFTDTETGYQDPRRPTLDGRVVAQAASSIFGRYLGHEATEALEYRRAHADVSDLVFDHTRSRSEYGGRGAKPCEIARDQRRRDDGIAFVLAEGPPAGDNPDDALC